MIALAVLALGWLQIVEKRFAVFSPDLTAASEVDIWGVNLFVLLAFKIMFNTCLRE